MTMPHPRPGPRNPWHLFVAFSRLSMLGFGGVLPLAHRELVDRLGWLDDREFAELLSVAQVLPGPNVVNLSLMIGDRQFGLRGAAAALAGMLLLPSVLVVVLAASYRELANLPVVNGALRGMGAVAAGMVLAMALKMLVPMRQSPLGRSAWMPVALAVAVAIGWLRWPLAAVVSGFGLLTCVYAAWRLRSSPSRQGAGHER